MTRVMTRVIHPHDSRAPVAQRQRRLEGLGETKTLVSTHLEAIHHRLDAVLLAPLEFSDLIQLHDLAVDPGTHVALGAQALEDLQMFAFAPLDHRSQQHQPRVLGQGEHMIHHLADRLCLQGDSVVGAAGLAGAGEQ